MNALQCIAMADIKKAHLVFLGLPLGFPGHLVVFIYLSLREPGTLGASASFVGGPGTLGSSAPLVGGPGTLGATAPLGDSISKHSRV